MQKSLSQWEAFLAQYFPKIKLLGEIPLTRNQVYAIGEEIRALLKRRGGPQGTHDLDVHSPRTFITYLALMAAHNTNRNYWGVITEALGTHDQAPGQYEWGSLFLRKLAQFRLPLFEEVGGFRFVTPIRMHGGIPAYSLPDYFEKILLPGTEQARYDELPTGEWIEAMLSRSEVQLFVDSPVRNFIEFGRQYALTFVEETRKMARAYKKHHDLPAPESLELPPYVLYAFRQFMEGTLTQKAGGRAQSPYLTLDAYTPEFYLHLPAQKVPYTALAEKQYFWQITYPLPGNPSRTVEYPVRILHTGYSPESETLKLPLETPVPYLDLAFGAKTVGQKATFIRESGWHLQILPTREQPPLRAFSPKTHQLVPWNQILPAQALWLLYPARVELRGPGTQHREVFDEFWGPWAKWQVQGWDLTQAEAVRLYEARTEVCAPIPVFGHTLDPYLEGGKTLIHQVQPDDTPIYIGEPPSLYIPARPGIGLQDDLADWKLTVRARRAASPALSLELPHLLKYMGDVQRKDEFFSLPLAAILGESPAGSYEMTLTGPGGSRKEFRFFIWPGVEIQNLRPYYLPANGKPPEVTFHIRVPATDEVLLQPAAQGITVKKVRGLYEITAGPEISRVPLFLNRPMPEGEPVRISLTLGLPRLRWTIPHPKETQITWHTAIISQSLDEFLQAEHKALRVEIPLATEHPLLVALRLNLNSDDLFQNGRDDFEVKPNQNHLRFPLDGFTDTLRQHPRASILHFELDFYDSVTNEHAYIPVFELRRKLEVQNVTIEHLDELTFRILWKEPYPFRNRRVRIWSVWNPWLPPLEYAIPDEARGELRVTETALPPGRYLLDFLVLSPWEREIPSTPGEQAHLVETISPAQQLYILQRQMEQHPVRAFLAHFEIACIYDSLKDFKYLEEEINWLYENLARASLPLMYKLYVWLAERNPSTYTALRAKLYKKDRLEKLFSTYRPNDPFIQQYLSDVNLVKTLYGDSAQFLIEKDVQSPLTAHAMQVLVKRGENRWIIEEIVRRCESGALSEKDALELLKINPEFSREKLIPLEATDIGIRLSQKLIPPAPEKSPTKMKPVVQSPMAMVAVGTWVSTAAGWGKIDKITDPETKTSLKSFDPEKQKPLLEITLRPKEGPERVKLDLRNLQLEFLRGTTLYQCNGCKGFITENQSYLTGKHNHFAHGGVHASLRILNSGKAIPLSQSPKYSDRPPKNEWGF